MENNYQSGNTIRLDATFKELKKDSNGNDVYSPFDPSDVYVKIYDDKYSLVNTFNVTKDSTSVAGYFYYDYTTPPSTTMTKYVYEFGATIDGLPIIQRNPIKVKFV